jgi:hypothetical protein
MKRIGMLDGQMTTTAKNAYDSTFINQPNPSHAEAMRQLFPDLQGEWTRRRASKQARLITDAS